MTPAEAMRLVAQFNFQAPGMVAPMTPANEKTVREALARLKRAPDAEVGGVMVEMKREDASRKHVPPKRRGEIAAFLGSLKPADVKAIGRHHKRLVSCLAEAHLATPAATMGLRTI